MSSSIDPDAKIEVGIDIETYSSVPIASGVYAYANSPDFEILLVAYRIPGDARVRQFIPGNVATRLEMDAGDMSINGGSEEEFLRVLYDPDILKLAYNANFERTCLAKYYGQACDPDQWRCTAVLASTLGLPRSLADAGAALGLPEDEQKMKVGKALIRFFCLPCAPTGANGRRTRNLPRHDMDKWRLFCEYNRQDVVTEEAIRRRLQEYEPNETEQRLWSTDQRICDRGIRIDRPFVEGIVQYDEDRQADLKAEAQELTGLSNPNSLPQLKAWLKTRGVAPENGSLSKAFVADELKRDDAPADVRRVLEIRQALGKTSTKKYQAMLDAACMDDRVRGMLQFYGANRTGRWAGRVVQLQNLPQNHIPDLDLARQLVEARDFEALELLYGEPAHVFSELIRTAFIPSDGNRFVVTDFSAIEARVIAWLADEEWRLEAFRNGKDIYCESASRMFHVPVEKHGQNAHLRQKGKVAELACGYAGGVGAMRAMDSAGLIPESELSSIVSQWREASPKIVKLWKTMELAAATALNENRLVKLKHGVTFESEPDGLFMGLPSGRRLCYWKARAEKRQGGGYEIYYMGVGTAAHSWTEQSTYGGKLVENCTQAVARDCLAEKLMAAESRGYTVVAHVHDEMIVDVPCSDRTAARDIDAMMAEPIAWAPGLPLKGGTYECQYYMKD